MLSAYSIKYLVVVLNIFTAASFHALTNSQLINRHKIRSHVVEYLEKT